MRGTLLKLLAGTRRTSYRLPHTLMLGRNGGMVRCYVGGVPLWLLQCLGLVVQPFEPTRRAVGLEVEWGACPVGVALLHLARVLVLVLGELQAPVYDLTDARAIWRERRRRPVLPASSWPVRLWWGRRPDGKQQGTSPARVYIDSIKHLPLSGVHIPPQIGAGRMGFSVLPYKMQ